jgi:hypothetical protein
MSDPIEHPPGWLAELDHEDAVFLRRFVLAAGSLKDLAEAYGVSYRTVRARLDRLIAKIRAADDSHVGDSFERKLRVLVADNRITPALAKELRDVYRATLNKRRDES